MEKKAKMGVFIYILVGQELGFSKNILQKNVNELFGQPGI